MMSKLKQEVKAFGIALLIIGAIIGGLVILVGSLDLNTARGFVVVLLLWGIIGPAGAWLIAASYSRSHVAGVDKGIQIRSNATRTSSATPAQVKPNVTDYLPKRDKAPMTFKD